MDTKELNEYVKNCLKNDKTKKHHPSMMSVKSFINELKGGQNAKTE